MSYIILDGSQIHVENSIYGNKKAYVLRISISDKLDIVLSVQMIAYDEKMISETGAQVAFDSKKRYKFFIEDVDYSSDGSSHYIDYKSVAGDEKDGIYIDKNRPIYSSPTGPDSVIIGYKGTIVGKCFGKGAYLTYDTEDQCNGFFRSNEFAHYNPHCLRLVVSPELSIPINSYYEKLWNIEEGKRYVFECQFGYDGGWGDPGYPQYAEYLYVSGFIASMDFDPDK